MKIITILLTKNESDIIELVLQKASTWSDKIIVYDGESTDGTWEKVKSMANDIVIPWKSEAKTFRESLRQEAFEANRNLFSEGDWYCQLNADEIFIDNPKEFLNSTPNKYHVVWGLPIEYYITEKDIEADIFDSNMENTLQNLRYYKVYHTEPRFFRYRKKLKWHPDNAWPSHLGLVCPKLIKFKHYPYRSPKQIQERLDIRRKHRENGFEGWEYASQLKWEEKIIKSGTCKQDLNNGTYDINFQSLPPFKDSFIKSSLKYMMHHILKIWP